MNVLPPPVRRNSLRMEGRDYCEAGIYFVTIVVSGRLQCLSTIKNGVVQLTRAGEIVLEEWLNTQYLRANIRLDEFIIMPDHLHGIIEITHSLRWNVSQTDPLESYFSENYGEHIDRIEPSMIGNQKAKQVAVPGTFYREGLNPPDSSLTELPSGHLPGVGEGRRPSPTPGKWPDGPKPSLQTDPTAGQVQKNSLSAIIGLFKSQATKRIRRSGLEDFKWQRSFHDRIIRNADELNAKRNYILQNPQRWLIDMNHEE